MLTEIGVGCTEQMTILPIAIASIKIYIPVSVSITKLKQNTSQRIIKIYIIFTL